MQLLFVQSSHIAPDAPQEVRVVPATHFPFVSQQPAQMWAQAEVFPPSSP
jgi:hypothetical protein